jgi:hypothetical protein
MVLKPAELHRHKNTPLFFMWHVDDFAPLREMNELYKMYESITSSRVLLILYRYVFVNGISLVPCSSMPQGPIR